jgi:hypothetical protein
MVMAIYVIVPRRCGGERGVQDLAAGTRVVRT